MNEKKLSKKMCSLIEKAIRQTIETAAELRKNFRLDVQVRPVVILDGQPLCVSMRLVETQQGIGRNTVHMLKDKWDRLHAPEVMVMESSNQENWYVMYSSEFSPSKDSRDKEWNRFSKTIHYPVVESEEHQLMLVQFLVDFLAYGLIEGKPYPGYFPA